MELIEKSKLISEGKRLLESNIFPNDIIESQREKRLRNEISKGILQPKDLKKFEDLSGPEKKKRQQKLKVQLQFINYLHALDRAKALGFIYIVAGIIVLSFAVIDSSHNLPFAIISIAEGLTIALLFRTNKLINKFHKIVLLALTGLIILEFALFHLPSPLLTILDTDILANKHSAFVKIVNASSPYLYITIKIVILLIIYFVQKSINKFFNDKKGFETGYMQE